MKNIKITLLFISIFFLATYLRLYHLNNTPVSVNLDEAAIAYDSYSILKTGKDQFENFMPLIFKSTNDYKMPLYIYLSVVPIKVFGLNAFAVRFPSAIAGILAVLLTYFLVKEIFINFRGKQKLAFLAFFLLAVSPWHLQFSRGAFEANVATMLNIAAILFFLKGLRAKNYLLLISFFLFGLTLFTYHSAKMVSPLILLFLMLMNYKQLLANKRLSMFALATFGLFILIFLPFANSKEIQMRFTTMNIFNLEQQISDSANTIVRESNEGLTYSAKIFHNRRLLMFNYDGVKRFLLNYLTHFNPDFYYQGDANRMYHAPGFGLVLFFEPIFLILGIICYFKYLRERNNMFIIFWSLLAFVPSALVWQAPSSVRSLIIMPAVQIFTGIGIFYAARFIQGKWRARLYLGTFHLFLIVCFCSAFSAYLHQYFVHLNYEYAKDWFYGKKEAVAYTESVKDKYQKILISNNRTDWQYMHWLFYSQYDPTIYLNVDKGTKSGDFRSNESFDKYEFINFNEKDTNGNGNVLIVGWPEDFEPIFIHAVDENRSLAKTLNTVKSIFYPNGKEALRIVTDQWVEQIIPNH
jgi:4-amino-4-deoxy-L-arabinose transferase-like glycosyltransferase